jgi:hypothetical protein
MLKICISTTIISTDNGQCLSILPSLFPGFHFKEKIVLSLECRHGERNYGWKRFEAGFVFHFPNSQFSKLYI